MSIEKQTEEFNRFAQNSTVPLGYITFLKSAIADVENKFNTKIYDYGVANKDGSDYEELIPFGFDAPLDANYILYLLVPIDDADNIITNDYYEKLKKVSEIPKEKVYSLDGWAVSSEFTSILKSDWDLSDYLKRKLQTEVYSVGALRVKEYKPNDRIVNHAKDIEDLRYRFIRFFSA